VTGERLPRPAGLGQRLQPRLLDQVLQRPHHLCEQRRPGRDRDGSVELLVTLDTTTAGRDVPLHLLQCRPDRRQVGIRTPGRGERGEFRLQRIAGLDDLGQPVRVSADSRDHRAGPDPLGQHRPVAVPDHHDPDHLERDQRLAQRGPADPQPDGEFTLGRQPITDPETVLVDPAGDLLGDLLIQPGTEYGTGEAVVGHAADSIDNWVTELLARPVSHATKAFRPRS
jgi:hypothetical protein